MRCCLSEPLILLGLLARQSANLLTTARLEFHFKGLLFPEREGRSFFSWAQVINLIFSCYILQFCLILYKKGFYRSLN